MAISLNFLMFGESKIRYLVIREEHHGFNIVTPQTEVDINGLSANEYPIFLTKDVGTMVGDQISSNMTRFINKSRDMNCLVKVCFNKTRIEGINNSLVVNFFGIKALFMALFTGTNTFLQKLVATKLWHLWLRCCDKELPPSLTYSTACSSEGCVPTAQIPSAGCSQLLDDVISCLDSNQERPVYSNQLRSLLNSLRSLCVKLKHEEVGDVLRSCDELIQSLIEYDTSQSRIDSVILEVASGWLGREFNAMTSTVRQAVNQFKSENIDSIDRLPSAYTTCCKFPKPMITLFENWMSSWRADSAQPASKMSRTDDIYPFIQLLLEFSNNALISGVAHVVYTQLLRDPT